ERARVVPQLRVRIRDIEPALVRREGSPGREKQLPFGRTDLLSRGRTARDEEKTAKQTHGYGLRPRTSGNRCPAASNGELDHGFSPNNAARAAATRAIGTRNGEHDT